MIEPVLFIAAEDDDRSDGILVFCANFDDLDDNGIYRKTHIKEDVLLWCRGHMLRVGLVYSDLTRIYNGKVWFENNHQRFEFKIRWSV